MLKLRSCKYYVINNSRRIKESDAVLMPCNPDYHPDVVALEEIAIVGRVIGAYRAL